MRIRFKWTWPACVAMLIVVAAGIALGQWQTRRADSKLALQQALDSHSRQAPVMLTPAMTDVDDMLFRPVKVQGVFMPEWVVYLENRPYRGQAGLYVLMPFKFTGSDAAVLVVRGWIPRDIHDRTRIAAYTTPPQSIVIDGVVKANAGQVLQLGQASLPAPGAMLQNLDLAAYTQASGLHLLPFVIEQTGSAQVSEHDGLVRDWPAPATGVDKHRGYAVQWYALSLTALIFFIVTGYRRGQH